MKTFTVGAVLDKYRYNTSIRFDFMLPMANFEDLQLVEKLDWSYLTDATFIVLSDGSDPNVLKSEMAEYVKIQNSYDPEWKVQNFDLILFGRTCSAKF